MATRAEKKIHQVNELEYRRKWLQQLRTEFRQICSWYRVSLAVPAFRITDRQATLGSWSPESRTISISATLINEFSWDAVINVLKHEMAHQYVHECMGRGMEQPHGLSFKEACTRLGVMYPFNTAAGNTPKVFSAQKQHAPDPDYERKINKVKKMFALAGSSNRHEAEAAMSKANSFIRKYNLERLDSAETPQYSYEIINTGKKRLQVIERRIAVLLMDFFFVDIVYSELFDQERLESFKTIEMLGTLENVVFARHVYGFLLDRLNMLWHNYRKTSGVPGKFRKTYMLGVLQGFREKLEKEENKNSVIDSKLIMKNPQKTISALVVAQDRGLLEFTARRFPRLRKVQYCAPDIYCAGTYSAGKAEGKTITVHRAVKHEQGNLGRFIGT